MDFPLAVKGATAGTPGTTGNFTPSAASSGYLAWSTVAAGWWGLVAYTLGSDVEWCYSYWNGTALTRGTNQFVTSTTGSRLSLTSSSTAELVIDGTALMAAVGERDWRGMQAVPNSTTTFMPGTATLTADGTSAGVTLSGSSLAGSIATVQYTSATTPATSMVGWRLGGTPFVSYGTASGAAQGEIACKWVVGTALSNMRFVAGGMTTIWIDGGDPSAQSANIAAFIKDAADTNINLCTKTSGGSSTKSDTGIALADGASYFSLVFWPSGGGKVQGLLVRMDTGAIWYGSITTNLPADNSNFFIQLSGGLSATGSAIVLKPAKLYARGP